MTFKNSTDWQVGVKEVILAVNYQPNVMKEGLSAIEQKVSGSACVWNFFPSFILGATPVGYLPPAARY